MLHDDTAYAQTAKQLQTVTNETGCVEKETYGSMSFPKRCWILTGWFCIYLFTFHSEMPDVGKRIILSFNYRLLSFPRFLFLSLSLFSPSFAFIHISLNALLSRNLLKSTLVLTHTGFKVELTACFNSMVFCS